MTNNLGRVYAITLAILVFFLSWAAIAARPWVSAPEAKTDPRIVALSARERKLRKALAKKPPPLPPLPKIKASPPQTAPRVYVSPPAPVTRVAAPAPVVRRAAPVKQARQAPTHEREHESSGGEHDD